MTRRADRVRTFSKYRRSSSSRSRGVRIPTGWVGSGHGGFKFHGSDRTTLNRPDPQKSDPTREKPRVFFPPDCGYTDDDDDDDENGGTGNR